MMRGEESAPHPIRTSFTISRMALSGLPLPDRAIVTISEHLYSRTRNRKNRNDESPKL